MTPDPTLEYGDRLREMAALMVEQAGQLRARGDGITVARLGQLHETLFPLRLQLLGTGLTAWFAQADKDCHVAGHCLGELLR